MLRRLKAGWIRTQAVADYFFTGLKAELIPAAIMTAIWGTVMSWAATSTLETFKNGDKYAASEELKEQVTFAENAALMRFPDNCDLGSGYYFISKKAGGGLELSQGNSRFTEILPISTQKELNEDIGDCMDTMRKWVKKDRLSFADEFYFVGEQSYSSPIIVTDINTGKQSLHKDILENKVENPDDLEEVVKGHPNYAEDGDNYSIYAAEFQKASDVWDQYVAQQNGKDPYFKGETIKDAAAYPEYKHDSLTDADSDALWGLSLSLTFLFLIGPNTTARRRSTGYQERKDKRAAQMAQLKVMDGRDTPIL